MCLVGIWVLVPSDNRSAHGSNGTLDQSGMVERLVRLIMGAATSKSGCGRDQGDDKGSEGYGSTITRLRGDGRRREQDTRLGNKKGDLTHVRDTTLVGNRHGKREQDSNSMGGENLIRR